MLPRRTRDTARLIVLDAAGRLLLFRYLDERGQPWWATPGGGLEAGESFDAAARREAWEELGLASVTLVPLWRDIVEFEARGVLLAQTEQFYLLRVARDAVDLGELVRHAHAAEGILETRWWAPAEIARAVEPVYPEDLADRTRHLVVI